MPQIDLGSIPVRPMAPRRVNAAPVQAHDGQKQ
jgi:hypothetical protein